MYEAVWKVPGRKAVVRVGTMAGFLSGLPLCLRLVGEPRLLGMGSVAHLREREPGATPWK